MNWKFMITVFVSHGLWLGNSFGLSEMAMAWEMFKSNPLQSLVTSITPSSRRTPLLSDFGQLLLLEKSHKTSSSVSRHVSGPKVNSGSNSRGQLNHPAGGVSGVSDSGVGSAGSGIVSHVGVSCDP